MWFAWWDGGVMRRSLMILCVIALLLAAAYIADQKLLPLPHSTVTRRT